MRSLPTEERFWPKVKKTDTCWIWMAGKRCKGYGSILIQRTGRQMLAHRYSYELVNGPIPKGLCVCHSCDNMACVNPKHLWLGTNADNVKDSVSKNRRARQAGASNPNSKMSPLAISRIRSIHASGKMTAPKLSRVFGLAQSQVYRILKNQSWIQGDNHV